MFDKKLYFRAITSFYSGMRKNAVGTTKKICDAHSDGVVDERTIRKWIKKLHYEDFSLADDENVLRGKRRRKRRRSSAEVENFCREESVLERRGRGRGRRRKERKNGNSGNGNKWKKEIGFGDNHREPYLSDVEKNAEELRR